MLCTLLKSTSGVKKVISKVKAATFTSANKDQLAAPRVKIYEWNLNSSNLNMHNSGYESLRH
jgi:hypothetical protein